MISERRNAILNLIIEHYLRTGEPVGSKTLCQLLPYSVSSATIRNEMAYLSELGFLEQRHTSGGRVPSKASYRYYIDKLMEQKELSAYDKQRIDEALSINSADPERLLADASRLLAEYTHCASFCCMLEDKYDCVQGVDLIPAGRSKAMLVMLTMGSKIKSSLINLPCPIDDEYRYIFYNVVKRFFVGTPLNEVNLALVQSAVSVAGDRIFDLLPALSSLCSLCSEASESKLTLEGETNLLSHTELGSDVYRLLTFLTEREQLIRLINSFSVVGNQTSLFIGEENPIYEMKNTATIISSYVYGNNQRAAIGVVGSVRIDYESILPKVNYITKAVEELLSKEGTAYE